MSFPSWAAAQAIIFGAKQAEKKHLIKELVQRIDHTADGAFGNSSENVQRQIVKSFLIPLCRELMKENEDEFKEILIQEAEPYRSVGGDELRREIGRDFGKGREVRPKNRRA